MKVINLIGQPSAGKTAMAAGLFYVMKRRHLNVELVPEYNKDIIYEDHKFAMNEELLIFSEKYKRIRRLDGKADYVITDSSLLNSIFYSDEFGSAGRDFFRLVADRFDNEYIFVERAFPYVPHGRMTDDRAADSMSDIIRTWLADEGYAFHVVRGDDAGLVSSISHLEEKGIVPRAIGTWSLPGV